MPLESGIEGLDEMVELPEDYQILLGGPPGTGKSAFALDYLFQGVENGQTVIFVTLRNSKEQIYEGAERRGYDPENDKFIVQESTDLMKGKSGQIFEPEKVSEGLRRNMNEYEADRIVLDSVTKFLMIFDAEPIMREQVTRLIDLIKGYEASALFIGEVPFSMNGRPSRYEISEFVLDGIFRIEHRDSARVFDILKMRGMAYDESRKELVVEDGVTRLDGFDEGPQGDGGESEEQ